MRITSASFNPSHYVSETTLKVVAPVPSKAVAVSYHLKGRQRSPWGSVRFGQSQAVRREPTLFPKFGLFSKQISNKSCDGLWK